MRVGVHAVVHRPSILWMAELSVGVSPCIAAPPAPCPPTRPQVEPYRVACEKHVGAVADFASSDEEEEADGEEGDQRGGRAQDRARESEGTGTYSETTSQDTLEDGSGIRWGESSI